MLPKLLEALRGLAFGGGKIVPEPVEQYDTRIEVTILFKHQVEHRPNWVSRARFIYEVHTRKLLVFLDYDGTGQYKQVTDLSKPIVLWRVWNPLTNKNVDFTIPFEPLTRAVRVFDALPSDDRAAAEAAAYRKRLRNEFNPYLGTWYRQGNSGRVCVIQFHDTGPRMIDDKTFWLDGYEMFRLTPDGRPEGLMFHGSRVEFSPDDRRIDFPQISEWWVREPRNQP